MKTYNVRLLAFTTIVSTTLAWAQSSKIDLANWGAVTAPVFGSAEKEPYAAAEFFAGPNKFGTYYAGVLPNGRIVKPAGISVQVGMNPLGLALTPDGKFLITSNDDEREVNFPSQQSTLNVGGYSLSVITAVQLSGLTERPKAEGGD